MTGLADNNSIDPFKLIPGEYVVHRKFGIGRFLGVRTISVDDPTNGAGSSVETSRIGYLFIEYADGTAKFGPTKLDVNFIDLHPRVPSKLE